MGSRIATGTTSQATGLCRPGGETQSRGKAFSDLLTARLKSHREALYSPNGDKPSAHKEVELMEKLFKCGAL